MAKGAPLSAWRETGEIPAPVMVWTQDQCGLFLDSIGGERLYALFHLAAYCGLRRSELAGLGWADVDLTRRRLHIREAQVDNALDSTKSDDSDRQVAMDEGTAALLAAWRKTQLAERLAWGPAWTDTGRVFTREDGNALRPGWISQRFGALAERAGAPPRPGRGAARNAPKPLERAGLPPIRFHDLRHGTATMMLAAGQPPRVISDVLGHATVAFTMDVYTEVAEALADAAAEALAAYIPRRNRPPAAE
jgi:integrase